MESLAFSGPLDFPEHPGDRLDVERLILRPNEVAFVMVALFSEGSLKVDAVATWQAVKGHWFVSTIAEARGGIRERADFTFRVLTASDDRRSCEVKGVWVALDRGRDVWPFSGRLNGLHRSAE